jgi:cellulose synthase/poly-beta-1,6-N-acetylglucosamine synthase-like glycosyltransferase
MNSFKSQQHRWAKGSVQTCRKLLPRILRSSMPFGVKAEAFFHLTANFNYPLMCVLSVLMAPAMVIRYNMGWYEMLLIDVPLFLRRRRRWRISIWSASVSCTPTG